MFDVNDVGALLHIAEKTLAFPKLKTLHDQAMTRLLQIAEDIKEPSSFVSSPPQTSSDLYEPGQVKEPDKEPTPDVRRV